jgi:hypothetical protein
MQDLVAIFPHTGTVHGTLFICVDVHVLSTFLISDLGEVPFQYTDSSIFTALTPIILQVYSNILVSSSASEYK